jgi:valyl-tRNA synthetase
MEFPKRYKHREVEPRIRELWEREGIYRFDPEAEGPVFSIDTPPPYVSSEQLHVGHAMSYSQAEFVVRYQRMRGRNVFYPMGFDDNGLPTERFVEKKYKIDKSKISRRDFIDLCLKETRAGIETYRRLWEAMAISVDWSLTYSTIDERSRRTSQRSFIELARAGLIERRDDPILWCYHCATAIAQAEVEAVSTSAQLHDVAFTGSDGRELVISTTRPELLPACVALYAHPDDQRYAALVGSKATVPLFGQEVALRTHPDVDPAFGTGLMMVCTWGDGEDITKWKEHDLETRHVLAEGGRLNELAGPFAGLPVREARRRIVAALGEAGKLRGSKAIEHNVGVHDRCKTPVEFNHGLQWFIKVLDHKDEFLARGAELRWYPDFMKVRLEDWIKGLKWDWCISRQRYYGVPFPVWYCGECGQPWLPPLDALPVDPTLDPLPAGAACGCGSTSFVPEQDVMDTWMTSSLTPLINARWAYDDAERMGRIYPLSIRVQAYEIIRTWLFYTVLKSHYHTASVPWTAVMISGWGLDSQGKKMSKSQGNFVAPEPVIEKYSADALRYWAAGATLGSDRRYSEQDVSDGKRLLTKLWNASRFVSSYLFSAEGEPLPLAPGEPTVTDRWIVSRLAATVRQATDAFEQCEYNHALTAAERFFFGDLCDNYLEIVKERFWKPERFSPAQVEAARSTLHGVLLTVLKLLAPFIPYLTEELYQIVFRPFGGEVSIHVSRWPEADAARVDAEAEAAGNLLVDLLTTIRGWKTAQRVHANFPLGAVVVTAEPEQRQRLAAVVDDLRAAAHAESVTFGDGGEVPTSVPGIALALELAEEVAAG